MTPVCHPGRPGALARPANVALLAAALLAASIASAGQPVPDAAGEQLPLRLPDREVRSAVLEALGRSATFARLVAGLGQRHAVVYVRWHPALPPKLRGAVMLRVIVTPEARYLWIGLKPDRVCDQLIAVIAHELAHVMEILDAGVSDPSAIAGLYARWSGRTGKRIYDTLAAVDTGELVRRELRMDRSTRPPNPPGGVNEQETVAVPFTIAGWPAANATTASSGSKKGSRMTAGRPPRRR